jgi:hypothetical protein
MLCLLSSFAGANEVTSASNKGTSDEEVRDLILNGKVTVIVRMSEAEIQLWLKDGTKVEGIGFDVNTLNRVLSECGDKCMSIVHASE